MMAGYYDELIDYVDWKQLCDDYNLKHGDISLDEQVAIENILKRFIKSNSYGN
jgi:hypothetical protein